MASYSALTHTRHHTRRVPGVPGSAERRLFNRGRDMALRLQPRRARITAFFTFCRSMPCTQCMSRWPAPSSGRLRADQAATRVTARRRLCDAGVRVASLPARQSHDKGSKARKDDSRGSRARVNSQAVTVTVVETKRRGDDIVCCAHTYSAPYSRGMPGCPKGLVTAYRLLTVDRGDMLTVVVIMFWAGRRWSGGHSPHHVNLTSTRPTSWPDICRGAHAHTHTHTNPANKLVRKGALR